jgi:hypothetical protein
MKRFWLIGSFVGGAACYLTFLVGCLGSEAGTPVSHACTSIGPLLRMPLLYWLPHAESRYLGVDSMILAIAGNAVFWGIVIAAIAALIARLREKYKQNAV